MKKAVDKGALSQNDIEELKHAIVNLPENDEKTIVPEYLHTFVVLK